MLWLGVVAIASSVIFFIAYNWDDLGRFAKFGLVEVLIAFSIFVYWRTSNNATTTSQLNPNNRHLISKAALLMASLFLGVLLAFYGQTYQTGADTWQLFFTWAVLIIPWVFIARFPALWIFWITLLNLSAVLYFQTFSSILSTLFSSEIELMWIMALLNLSAFIIWEILKKRWEWLSENWATRVLVLAGSIPLSLLAIDFILGFNPSVLAPLLWLVGMIFVYIIYRKRSVDLFMLTMGCLSGISVILSVVSKLLFDVVGSEFSSFLLLAILVVILGGLSAKWLKSVHKEINEARTLGTNNE